VTRPAIPPVFEVFFSAFALAESEGVREIRLDHLLTALDGLPYPRGEEERSSEPYMPVPHNDKPFSNEARAALDAACALARCGVQDLTTDALRAAVLAARPEPAG
jgi:hypothetical protein